MFARIRIRRNRFTVFILIVLSLFIYGMYKYRSRPDLRSDLQILLSEWKAYRTETKLVEGFGNYEPIVRPHTDGPGENGIAYNYAVDMKPQVEESLRQFGINDAVSKLIALNRSIPDSRPDECKHWSYPEKLWNVSVIIVFHNEALSILKRTFHTVLFRSPKELIHEIILVDDFSDKPELGMQLEQDILNDPYYHKVKVIRNAQREGLIRSKNFGVQQASGEIVLFLDAHCEVNTNWLPPLIAPIVRDPNTMTVPYVDGIDFLTFEYQPVYGKTDLVKGIFEWGLLYKEKSLTKKELEGRKYRSAPYDSPTHAGGLFAIRREYFIELGMYDPGLLIWGGENFELSFKIWQCGGHIKWVPCSRVGHIYRNPVYGMSGLANKITAPIDQYNYKRVVEVWMDPKYKEYFYTRNPKTRYIEFGDISEQLSLKQQLKCKNFDWFMENVAADVYDEYPALPANLYWGQLQTETTSRCLAVKSFDPPADLHVLDCNGNDHTQVFRLNERGQITCGERCIEVLAGKLIVDYCSMGKVSGHWSYHKEDKMLYNNYHDKCLTINMPYDELTLEACDDSYSFQNWKFVEVK